MITIQTKYLGPTDFNGSRYKAFDSWGHKITIGADHALSLYDNHLAAARKLAAKLGYTGKFYTGEIDGGMVFLQADGNEAE